MSGHLLERSLFRGTRQDDSPKAERYLVLPTTTRHGGFEVLRKPSRQCCDIFDQPSNSPRQSDFVTDLGLSESRPPLVL